MKGMAIADLDHDGRLDLAVFEGASSGLLDEDDIADAGGVLEPGSSAGILVYENVWAAVCHRASAWRCATRRERTDSGAGSAGRNRCRSQDRSPACLAV